MSFMLPDDTNTESPPAVESGVPSAIIISFEVVFSVSVFVTVAACYYVGMRRRNRRKQATLQEYEDMVERALTRQMIFRPTQVSVDSSSSIDGHYHTHLPPYLPPATNSDTPRLSERDVSRLSQAMLNKRLYQSQSLSLASPPYPPPKYSDVIESTQHPSCEQTNAPASPSLLSSSSPAIRRPLSALVRSSHSERRSSPSAPSLLFLPSSPPSSSGPRNGHQ